VCNGRCAVNWPPFTPRGDDKSARDFTIIKRDDGSSQWAYKGKPLYFYEGDKQVGGKNGEGLNGVWHVAK
jgi:predicted lipoprotein with Yx(FWY)xxD motif